jgi:hypothetical protein
MSEFPRGDFEPRYSEMDLEIERFGGVAIYSHPVFEWMDKHIDEIKDKVLYGIMSNIVPLGDSGRIYFMRIAMKRSGSFVELMNLYASMEKMFNDGFMQPSTYASLYSLGYNGPALSDFSPADDVFKFNNMKTKRD